MENIIYLSLEYRKQNSEVRRKYFLRHAWKIDDCFTYNNILCVIQKYVYYLFFYS